jgi:hypothetical protein
VSNQATTDPEFPEMIQPVDLSPLKRESQIQESRSPDGSTGSSREPTWSVVVPSVNQIRPSEVR